MAPHPYKQSSPIPGSSSSPDGNEKELLASGVRLPSKASKRIRGEIACAECRRLKIKCDKNIPCSTCLKRGCASLCPNGTIPPGQGSRFVLAATDHLRGKLSKLEARMHSLEDALAIVYSSNSTRTHPLLVKGPEEENDILGNEAVPSEDSSTLSEAIGTLFVEHDGASRFFGPSGSSESLLLKAKSLDASVPHQPQPELEASYLPADINYLYQSFPFTPPNRPVASIQASIEYFLPPIQRAIELCNTFLEHLSWMFQIVTRQQMMNELIPIIYKQKKTPYGPHDLALLLIVLGNGALVDLNSEPYNLEAQHYYRLARAAVTLQPILTQQSIVTIKVLHLMSIYNGLSGKESNLEQSYALLNLAGQVSVRIGFHIDPSMWGFEGKEAYDRRVYFWNLLQGSLWQCLVTGRPPAILSDYIDCRIPTPADEELYQRGEVPLGFGIWGHLASDNCLVHVVRANLAAKPPNYESVLKLDKKIREFFSSGINVDLLDERTPVSMKAFVRSHYQDLMLMFLHRSFFVQSMTEYPSNPMSSPYAFSINVAYQSACVILEETRVQFLKKPFLVARIWRIWSFAFVAAVVVGTTAIHSKHMNISPLPIQPFEVACSMFRSVARTSSRARKALPVLEAMLHRCFQTNYTDPNRRLTKDPSMILDNTNSVITSMEGFHTNIVAQARHLQDPLFPRLNSSSLPDINQPHILPPENAVPGQTTFAGLSDGWEGMFHETSSLRRIYTDVATETVHGEDVETLDDRWSSFMHNYSILDDTSQYHC